MRLGQLEQPAATLDVERAARWVLERGQEVEERGPRIAHELGLQRVRIDAVPVVRHADRVDPAAGGNVQRAVVRRRLHEQAPLGGEAPNYQVEALQ